MAIRLVTSASAVDKFLYKALDILNYEIRRCLAKLGEECIARIRDRSGDDSWFDQTGNLRSSVGYAIYAYGEKKIQSAFNIVGQGSKGRIEGKRFIDQLASEYLKAYALVVVATMNYANYVEALESKDVLASTELWAKGVIDTRIRKAKNAAIEKINKLAV